MQFTPTKKMDGIVLEAWAPPQLSANQVLHIDVNGRGWQQHISRGSRCRIELTFRASADTAIELTIRAEHAFNPARVSDSADSRDLAWKLIKASLLQR